MSAEQWIGVLLLVLGSYLCVCSAAFPNFLLYRMKASQATAIFGEKTANRFFFGLGVLMLIAGVFKTVGLF